MAIVLLVSSGAGYRFASARLAELVGTVPLPRGTLNGLPAQIGVWRGRDVPLDERVVEATDTDDHINRVYQQQSRNGAVTLFVAYGVRMRDLMPHRPEVCYPGNGWTLEQSRQRDLQLSDGSSLPCQVHAFTKPGLASKRISVLNYYIVDGRSCADVSLLRSKSWRFGSDFRYAAQIQIASHHRAYGEHAEESVRAFGEASAPVIREFLQSVVEKAETKQNAGSSSPDQAGGEA